MAGSPHLVTIRLASCRSRRSERSPNPDARPAVLVGSCVLALAWCRSPAARAEPAWRPSPTAVPARRRASCPRRALVHRPGAEGSRTSSGGPARSPRSCSAIRCRLRRASDHSNKILWVARAGTRRRRRARDQRPAHGRSRDHRQRPVERQVDGRAGTVDRRPARSRLLAAASAGATGPDTLDLEYAPG